MFRLSVHPMDKRVLVSVLGQYLGFLPQGYVPLGDGYKLAAFGGELNVFKPLFPDNQREAQLLFQGAFSLWLTWAGLETGYPLFCDAFVFTMVRKVSISRKVHKQLLKYKFS